MFEVGQQTLIGSVDVKSTPVYFTAVRERDYATVGTIPYDKALLNIGDAMNIATGNFTAPRNGIYFFSLTLCASTFSWADIRLNGTAVAQAVSYGNNGRNGAGAQVTLELKAEDVVFTSLGGGNSVSNVAHLTHFTGFLLQQL